MPAFNRADVEGMTRGQLRKELRDRDVDYRDARNDEELRNLLLLQQGDADADDTAVAAAAEADDSVSALVDSGVGMPDMDVMMAMLGGGGDVAAERLELLSRSDDKDGDDDGAAGLDMGSLLSRRSKDMGNIDIGSMLSKGAPKEEAAAPSPKAGAVLLWSRSTIIEPTPCLCSSDVCTVYCVL